MNRRRRKSYDQLCHCCQEARAIWAIQNYPYHKKSQVVLRPVYCNGCVDIFISGDMYCKYIKTYTKQECKREICNSIGQTENAVLLLNKWAHQLMLAETKIFEIYGLLENRLTFPAWFYVTKIFESPSHALTDIDIFKFINDIQDIGDVDDPGPVALQYYRRFREYMKREYALAEY